MRWLNITILSINNEEWATEPKKTLLLSGGAHGLEILGYEDVNPQIMDWINTRIED